MVNAGPRKPARPHPRQAVEDNAKDLDSVTSRMEEIVERLCEYAQTPCNTEDFAPLRKYRNLICNFADQLEMVRPELSKVVKHFDTYLAKPVLIPAIGSLTPPAVGATQERAMEQEHARGQLHTAVSAAQQKIRRGPQRCCVRRGTLGRALVHDDRSRRPGGRGIPYSSAGIALTRVCQTNGTFRSRW